MSDPITAHTFARIRAHHGKHLPRQSSIALRMLLMAWWIDDTTISPMLSLWLKLRLDDHAWIPSPEDCAMLQPGLMAWAERYGVTTIVTDALEEKAV